MGFATFYQEHFGGAHSKTQLYLGFALFFAGVTLALSGIVWLLVGDAYYPDLGELLSRDQVKLSVYLAALGLPLIFFGAGLTLPSRKIIHLVAGIGSLICLYGSFRFNEAFRTDVNEFQGIDAVIGSYTIGLLILVTTTGLSLVINFVSRYVVLPGQEMLDPYGDQMPDIDTVMADIEREVAKQSLSWGGMGGDELSVRQIIKIRADFGEDAFVNEAAAGTTTTETHDDTGDLAFRSLMQMRGRDVHESTDDETDTQDAVAALVALRKAKQVELERSWWYRFKRWFFSLFLGRRDGKAGGR